MIVKRYIIRSDNKTSRPRKFPSKTNSSASKGYEDGSKIVDEKKEGPKCFNCGGTSHFTGKCKSKKVDTNKDYEVKYKNILASFKMKNINVNVLVVVVVVGS